MSKFNELLAQLKSTEDEQNTLAKALPAEDGKDDKQIQAAAAEGENAENDNPEDIEDEGDGKGEGGEPMAKSVTAVVNGEEVEAIDATDLLKSLEARVSEHDDVLVKSITSVLETVKSQTVMIKSLQDRVAKLSGQGAGRKTVLTVIEKPAAGEQEVLAKSEQGMTPAQFMAKATAAFEAKKITGKELTTIDVALRSGQASVLDEALIAKALS